jgi:hypothetical protein
MGDTPMDLQYASRGAQTGWTERRLRPSTIACLLLTLLAASTCVRIEVLNANVGFYLPRSSEVEDASVTWRAATPTIERRWREIRSRRLDDASILTRPLTVVEQAEMRETLRQNNRWNALLEAVSTWGLLQYPLVAVLLPWCLWLARKHDRGWWRRALYAATAVVLACGVMMVYRGYFTSLGM